ALGQRLLLLHGRRYLPHRGEFLLYSHAHSAHTRLLSPTAEPLTGLRLSLWSHSSANFLSRSLYWHQACTDLPVGPGQAHRACPAIPSAHLSDAGVRC